MLLGEVTVPSASVTSAKDVVFFDFFPGVIRPEGDLVRTGISFVSGEVFPAGNISIPRAGGEMPAGKFVLLGNGAFSGKLASPGESLIPGVAS